MNQGEHPRRQTPGCGGADNGPRHEFGSAGVGGMRLHDDGVARREGRGRVPPGDGKRQGKIARAKDGHGADRPQHAADIRAGKRLAVGQSRIDASIDPIAVARHGRKQAQLRAGPCALAAQAGERQGRLLVGALQQGVTDGFDFGGDRFKECRTCFPGCRGERTEGARGRFGGGVNFLD